MKKVLATDLDGTLIPLHGDENHVSDLKTLDRLLNAHNISLVFVTGRHLDSVQQAIAQFSLPTPDCIICDVGSSIFVRSSEAEDKVDNIQWTAESAYIDCLQGKLGNTSLIDLRMHLADEMSLRLQEEEKQGRFKLSFYVDASELEKCVGLIGHRLPTNAKCEIIASVDPFNGDGLIDVLPNGVSKAFALDWWLAANKVDSQDAIFSGDSGNDFAAMTAGYRTIVVGNASPELVGKVRKSLLANDWSDRLYVAQSQATSGVLEGCRHWKLF